uniref:E3 ubiquitin-protein ligase TRIM39-like n=1 Tax=Sinocyclocheilus anshuiensis TaxID=1608454 RepID=A0A671MQH5_9TELE
MESSISRLSEKHFLCSLCEEIFSNPVTTPCGHSFCKACLRVYWNLLITHPTMFYNVPESSRIFQKLLECSHLCKSKISLKKHAKLVQKLICTIPSFSDIPRAMRDWSKVTLETDPCVGFTGQAVVDFMDTVTMEAKRLSKAANRPSSFSVDVNLNPRTAHTYLYISEDRKEVRHANKRQEVPENPKRFDRVANVMSKEAFSYGRHLWEVEVGDKTDWDLGVAKQSVNRKGKFTICPANGFWMLSLKNGTQFTANTFPPTFFSLSHKPKRVSIYLDYEEGRVSFYCLDTGTHIYTFKDAFTDKLHPIFSPGRPHGEKNTAPLIISSSCCSI